ncbi:MAG: cupin domain-containing protein [Candidatus Korobacteraceae bacterium]
MKIKIVFCILVIAFTTAAAQQAPSNQQAQPSGTNRQNPERPREYPPNDRIGIDIDRFVGHPSAAVTRVSHEVILTQSILRAGDPHNSGEPGAVLEYRKDFAVGTLLPNNATPQVKLPLQQIFYIQTGQGRLDDGSQYWDLREGIAVLIPQNVPHRITNTGDEPLSMLMLSWENPAGVTPRKGILVRDVRVLPFAEQNAHWNYMAKNLFHPSDGLHQNEKVLVVYVPPVAMGGPHAHPPHWEEVWTNLGPESAFLMLGSELREMPVNTGFIAPPNGQTVHSVLNTSRNKVQAFFYFARYTTPAPDDFGDAGTVPGKPLR